MLQNQALEVKLSIRKNLKSYRMINVEVVMVTIHSFEILQKGTQIEEKTDNYEEYLHSASGGRSLY